ncbi:MAG: hypothetical protein WA151_00405 [Desulfatirhabdiaceae bacterium]
MWYSIENNQRFPSGQLYAEVEIGVDSPWFSGHFPGEPVLPGIAQLSMVMETIRQATSVQVRISGLKRVRFKQIVRPESRLQVFITPNTGKTESSYSFQIKAGDDIVCSGIMITEE